MTGVKRICSECKVENKPGEITLHLERSGQEYIAAPISKAVLETAEKLAADLEATKSAFVRMPAGTPPFRSITVAVA